MTILFPPVIESQGRAFPFNSAENIDSRYYDIQFPMPSINSVQDIKHVQVCIKYQSTGQPAVNSDYAPDGQTIFISANSDWFSALTNGNYRVRLPYKVFEGGFPRRGTTYLFQVRFGRNSLWTTGDGLNARQDFDLFAAWRQASVTQIPSMFGEWSNLQKAYCYATVTHTIDFNFDDFMPEIVWGYSPAADIDDPIEQVKVSYVYEAFEGEIIKSQVYSGQYSDDNTFTLRAKLPIAPVKSIQVAIEAVTKNNAIWTDETTIPSLLQTHAFIEDKIGEVKEVEMTARELEDGVLAKTLKLPEDLTNVRINVYRINCLTLSCDKIIDKEYIQNGEEMTFKDFTVEMGEDYQYVFCSLENGGMEFSIY